MRLIERKLEASQNQYRELEKKMNKLDIASEQSQLVMQKEEIIQK